ncbi:MULTISPECIES: GerW family sporulation protein [Niastella]|uniref:Sporulation protein n=1 Tax=Niastella soli TaxID=2821487 RepID=A0ABS3YUK7_9BACT|nr:spore germination protein GerW family protein [Niastella soli]MBO9201570.1 hypothetical protein [Niastella soli]
MGTDNFIEKLASQFGQSATVKNVYGEPVHSGNKTIIPVAQIAYGCGGGYEQGKKKLNQLKEPINTTDDTMEEGAGGGGGMYAKAKGVYEITPTCTRFIPASGHKILVTGLLIGFVLRGLFSRK